MRLLRLFVLLGSMALKTPLPLVAQMDALDTPLKYGIQVGYQSSFFCGRGKTSMATTVPIGLYVEYYFFDPIALQVGLRYRSIAISDGARMDIDPEAQSPYWYSREQIPFNVHIVTLPILFRFYPWVDNHFSFFINVDMNLVVSASKLDWLELFANSSNDEVVKKILKKGRRYPYRVMGDDPEKKAAMDAFYEAWKKKSKKEQSTSIPVTHIYGNRFYLGIGGGMSYAFDMGLELSWVIPSLHFSSRAKEIGTIFMLGYNFNRLFKVGARAN